MYNSPLTARVESEAESQSSELSAQVRGPQESSGALSVLPLAVQYRSAVRTTVQPLVTERLLSEQVSAAPLVLLPVAESPGSAVS